MFPKSRHRYQRAIESTLQPAVLLSQRLLATLPDTFVREEMFVQLKNLQANIEKGIYAILLYNGDVAVPTWKMNAPIVIVHGKLTVAGNLTLEEALVYASHTLVAMANIYDPLRDAARIISYLSGVWKDKNFEGIAPEDLA